MIRKNNRIEFDSLGAVEVPSDALYGGQTVRSVENFKITQQPVHTEMIHSLGMVKKACIEANNALNQYNSETAEAMLQACDEIIDGQHNDQFLTDAIQGGAGTSLNMNMNEVISNRAAQLLNKPLGDYHYVHPNDHANMGQSTNDVIPTAAKLTTLKLGDHLINEMQELSNILEGKAIKNKNIIKVGRTHLQDAVLISMGQVFESYATMIRRDARRLKLALEDMKEINLGATAIGTEINTVLGYRERAVKELRQLSGYDLYGAQDLIDGTKNVDTFAYVHTTLKTFATNLSRMCNDLRMMASGPKVGLNEINLPAKQPGSSIMPGKVNPVIPEVVNQVCFQVIGNDLTISMASEAGQMELNVFEPILFYNLFQSFDYLTNACVTLGNNALKDLTVNEDVCFKYVEESLAMGTSLVKILGYEKATALTAEALESNKTLRELVLEKELLDESETSDILNPYTLAFAGKM